MRRVTGFTNCARAELLVNGRSLGGRTPTDEGGHVVHWDVPYEPGTLTLNGLGPDGTTVIATDTFESAGPAAQIVAQADTVFLTSDGMDVAHILATIADTEGRRVSSADNEITWSVSGSARLLGLENGDIAHCRDYGGVSRPAFQGRLLGYVQATRTAGPVTVTLTSPGLSPAHVTLQAQ